MMKFFVVVLLLAVGQSRGDSVTRGTKLISTLLMHRHGDRTPEEASVNFSTDPDALIAASAPYGYGQLTNVGTNRAYNLGKSIRARYNELIAPRYNRSEIYIRSTDVTRAKMTILTALSAIYPAYPGSWSNKVNWVPTPYTTVPAKYDFNQFTVNCPNFISAYYSLFLSNPTRMSKYANLLELLSADSGYNITQIPNFVYAYNDVYATQISLGIPLPADIAARYSEVQAAAGDAIDLTLGNSDYVRLEAGVVLNEFFTQADNLIAGTDTPRVRIYSAHDLNVYAFEAAAQLTPRQGVPKYTAYLALELRQVKKTGEYVVLGVYQSEPGAKIKYLTAAGCGSVLCPYDTYKELVSAYTVDVDTWRSECGFTEDLVVADPE